MTTILGPDGAELVVIPPELDALIEAERQAAAGPDRRIRLMPEIAGFWAIDSRHHQGALLLPAGGDPELDRFYIAARARDTLDLDWRQRANKQKPHGKRARSGPRKR